MERLGGCPAENMPRNVVGALRYQFQFERATFTTWRATSSNTSRNQHSGRQNVTHAEKWLVTNASKSGSEYRSESANSANEAFIAAGNCAKDDGGLARYSTTNQTFRISLMKRSSA